MLKLSYISLSLLMLIILFLIGNYAIQKSISSQQDHASKKRILLSSLLLWHLYILAIGSTQFLTDLSFPPRIALFLIIPTFLFIGFFIRKNWKKNWIQSIPSIWLVLYQSFRIAIESIFIFTVAAGLLHKNVTIKGYNYDMLYAISAIFIAIIVHYSTTLPKKLLLAWNFLGLAVIAVIIFLFLSSIYFPELYGPNTAAFPTEFGKYPYVLVPGFLMPSAVFIHALSIAQLMNIRK